MTDYVWCHGPNCHKRKTTTRVRGVKGSKVLRTVKIAQGNQNAEGCGNTFVTRLVCMNFIWEHYRRVCSITPKTRRT